MSKKFLDGNLDMPVDNTWSKTFLKNFQVSNFLEILRFWRSKIRKFISDWKIRKFISDLAATSIGYPYSKTLKTFM